MKKKILIYLQRDWGINIGHKLAILFKDKLDCSIGAIVSKRATYDNLKQHQNTLYNFFLYFDEIVENPKKFLKGDKIDLEDVCKRLGVNTVWDLVQSLRNHVKSYKDKYYYGFKQNVHDEDIVDLICATFKVCQKIEKDFSPDIIILPNFVSLQHIFLSIFFNKLNRKFLSFSTIGTENIGIFVNNYQEDKSSFITKYNELNFKEFSLSRYKEVKFLQDSFYEKIRNNKIILDNIKFRDFLIFFKKIYLSLNRQNLVKKVGSSIDHISFGLVVRDFFSKIVNINFIKKTAFSEINNINKFIYLPLQFQPEANIDVLCSFFNNQLETARQIAMKLPYDYTLVVKDHPRMYGLRSKSYLEKIIRTPNVKLVSYQTPNFEILKKTKLVIAFSGASTILEAAIMKVPVIQLGISGVSSSLPNVFCFNDLINLDKKILNILQKKLFNEDYDKKLVNYFIAALETGFDLLNYNNLWNWKGGDINKLFTSIVQELNVK